MRFSEFPLKKLGWLEIFRASPVWYSGQTSAGNSRDNHSGNNVSAVPIVRAVIRFSVLPLRRIVTVGIISVIARTEPDTEVNLSIRARRPCKDQNPNYDCNQQKFLHNSPRDNLAGGSV